MSKIYKIYIIFFLFSFLSAQKFLEGVKPEDLTIDKIVAPEPKDTMGRGSDLLHFYYPTSKVAFHPSGKLKAELRPDGNIWIVDISKGKEICIEFTEFPQWSPNGKYLGYIRPVKLPKVDPKTGLHYLGPRELWVCDSSGKNEKALTPGESVVEFLWTCDSKYIVYEGHEYPHGRYFIGVVDVETGKKIVIDSGGFYTDMWFSISPNGKMIAYTKPFKEELIHEWVATEAELFIASIDGSSKKQITNTKEAEWAVKWLPDGRSLIVEQLFWVEGEEEKYVGERKVIKILLKKIK